MDVGRSHKTPESDTKDGSSLKTTAGSRVPSYSGVSFPKVISQSQEKALRALQERNPELKYPESLMLDYKQTCPIFPHTEMLSLLYWTENKHALCCSRRDYLCLPKLFGKHSSLKIQFEMKRQLGFLFSRHAEIWEIYGE